MPVPAVQPEKGGSVSDYKPGTVAVVNGRRAFRVGNIGWHLRPSTAAEDEAGTDFVRDADVTEIRPLVVLGPEGLDATALGRAVSEAAGLQLVVLDLYAANDRIPESEVAQCAIRTLRASDYISDRGLADQIEAQTKPPKPAEPTGLGAVVEDADGLRWVRVADDGLAFAWRPVGNRTSYEDNRYWKRVAAVSVLSEGVAE